MTLMFTEGKDAASGLQSITLKRNGLTMECFLSDGGRLRKKIEHWDGNSTEFAYRFDSGGHLLAVFRNGEPVEEYLYNRAGQRIGQRYGYRGFSDGTTDFLYYDAQGKLVKAGAMSFCYDSGGALAERHVRRGTTRFFYGKDTLLDTVVFPSGARIRYEYDKVCRIVPARRFRDDCLPAEYLWLDALRLSAYLDHERQLEYIFRYDASGLPDRVRIASTARDAVRRPGPDNDWAADDCDWLDAMLSQSGKGLLHTLLGNNGNVLELRCCTDQVGTLNMLTNMDGRPVKEIRRDSFGVRLSDSFPDLFMPIGFAGGLEDPDTGLVHFGHRDYDPRTGRFTAPDPLGDTGGDHDLYDYCVDDPVSMNDPLGLFPPLLLFLGGKALALALGLGGAYGAAKIADSAGSDRDAGESTAARDAVQTVAPMVAGTSSLASVAAPLPAAAVMAPGLVASSGQRLGAALESSAHAKKIMTGLTHAAQFADGYLLPVSPVASSFPGSVGAIAARLTTEFQKWQKSKK